MSIDITNITLDLRDLTLGDVEILSDQTGRFTMSQKLDALVRVCPGTDVRSIPLMQLGPLMERIEKEMETVSNPL